MLHGIRNYFIQKGCGIAKQILKCESKQQLPSVHNKSVYNLADLSAKFGKRSILDVH